MTSAIPRPSLPAEAGRPRVFVRQTLAERATSWERGDDPLSQLTFTDGYDARGRARARTEVALPRRSMMRRPVVGAVVGAFDVDERRILASHARTVYATPDAGLHLHDRVAHTVELELAAPAEVVESDPGNLTRVLQDWTAAAYRVHRQFREALEGWTPGHALPSDLLLTGHTINHYDGTAFVGRPAGEVGPYGALTRTEALVFTSRELDRAYGAQRPVYLGGPAGPPAGAPVGFGTGLGYRREPISAAAGYQDGYYADARRLRRDFQEPIPLHRRGFVTAIRDARGHDTTVFPDVYWQLPARIVDAAGLETRAEYDYRVMQVRTVTDANGIAAGYRYTASGLLSKRFLVGQHGEGGSEAQPELELEYDFLAFHRTRDDETPQPIFVHSRRRVHHASDGTSNETIESREYSDGFGRVIQKRDRGETLLFDGDGDDVGLTVDPTSPMGPAVGVDRPGHVLVSGWQMYDNKGRPIRKYEPFHASGWAFQPEAESRRGQYATLVYDARGQLTRTITPDGSQQWTVLGVPPDLTDPRRFSPTPWERYSYDANDLAPRSQALGAQAGTVPSRHFFTPTSTVLDARGRAIATVERNGSIPARDWYVTRTRYDRRGGVLERIDALGRHAFRQAYDLLGNLLRVESIDAGIRTSVLDASGNSVETREPNGAVVLREYDALNRPTHVWALDTQAAGLTLRERLIYGDNGPQGPARANHLLGRLVEHADESGLLRIALYDFKGNVLERSRQVVADAALASGWLADWRAANASAGLDATVYETSFRYDALDRPLQITLPRDVSGQRHVIGLVYNRSGTLERVSLDGAPYVERIAYNAKGQRILIVCANGVMTRYAYHSKSFRLVRLRSERVASSTQPHRWSGSGPPLQDFSYRYDLAGNIVAIEERTPECGVAGSIEGRDVLTKRFQYDPLYRLTAADGRACRDIPKPRALEDVPRCGATYASYAAGPPTVTPANAS